MPAQVEKFRIPAGADEEFMELLQDFAAPGKTDIKRLIGDVIVTFTGTATEAVVRVERASRLLINPSASDANWAPVDVSPFNQTINPSAGAEVAFYREPTMGWWRVNVISVTGGTVSVNISGTDA